nr:glycosyltransferase [uncultured Albidiferax sp.]
MALSKLTVEVVVCTYNGAPFLSEQLQSIAGQTQKVDCISVYDDGSTDATWTLVGLFAEQLSPTGTQVRRVRNPHNLGYAQNFAQALARAQADVVFLCDQDDIWEPNKVERMVTALERSGCAMVFCDGSLINAAGEPIPGPSVLQTYGMDAALATHFTQQAWPALLRRNYVNGAAMAVRRIPAQRALPVPAHFPHDYWMALWLALDGGIACIPELLYRYRQHGNNQIGIGTTRRLHQWAAIWRNPSPSRRLDLQRSALLLERLPAADPRLSLLRAKKDWLQRVVGQGERGRGQRLVSICAAVFRRDYARFAPPYALLRDLVAAIQGR